MRIGGLIFKTNALMKRICLITIVVTLLSGWATGQTKEEVIEKIWEAAGGRETWKDSRFLTFVFAPQKDGRTVFKRSHLWDRQTGDYRFETITASRETLLVLFNVNKLKGKSFVNGKPLSDSLNTIEVKKAYEYFINDSYWLIAPLKLEDPELSVNLEDSEVVEGTTCEVLHIDIAKGINAGHQFWLYVDSNTGLIKRWKVLPAGKKEPGIYNWTSYKDLGGGLKLSTRKQNINQNKAITFPVASVLISVEPAKFTKK